MIPRRIALALGDPNGIGPEIVLKALAALREDPRVHLTVFGPRNVLEHTAVALRLHHLLAGVAVRASADLASGSMQAGRVDPRAGESAVASATAAIEACLRGECDAVVAAPHNETAIAQAGVAFRGYPTLVAKVCRQPEDSVFLMLVAGDLRIVHVTLHESVVQAVSRIRAETVYRAAKAGVRACEMLGVSRPRIALFGINPHASEGGLWGQEDLVHVVPAAERLRRDGLPVDGPVGADVLLADRRHDLYVAMLHDQGHIPVKMAAPQGASALSVGSGVVLATTGHGSAMDIAGAGVARPDALLRSIRLLANLPTDTSA